MMTQYVAIDGGNSAIKIKMRDEQNPDTTKRWVFSRSSMADVLVKMKNISPDIIAVADVVSDDIAQQLKRFLPKTQVFAVQSQRQCMGVTNAYAQNYQALGIDRWLSVIEGHYLANGKPCQVFDLGTANTVDIVDGQGHHLGGQITPGLAAMKQALYHNTAAVRVCNDQVNKPYEYGTNTQDSVGYGVISVVASWVNGMRQTFLEQFPDGTVLATGGATDAMEINLRQQGVRVEGDLVLDALLRGLGKQAFENRL